VENLRRDGTLTKIKYPLNCWWKIIAVSIESLTASINIF
jgi:hypothetical protein